MFFLQYNKRILSQKCIIVVILQILCLTFNFYTLTNYIDGVSVRQKAKVIIENASPQNKRWRQPGDGFKFLLEFSQC